MSCMRARAAPAPAPAPAPAGARGGGRWRQGRRKAGGRAGGGIWRSACGSRDGNSAASRSQERATYSGAGGRGGRHSARFCMRSSPQRHDRNRPGDPACAWRALGARRLPVRTCGGGGARISCLRLKPAYCCATMPGPAHVKYRPRCRPVCHILERAAGPAPPPPPRMARRREPARPPMPAAIATPAGAPLTRRIGEYCGTCTSTAGCRRAGWA